MYEMLSWRTRREGLPARPLLPAEDAADAERADLLILANGLQRLLRRCAEGVAQRHFPAVLQADRALRVQLRLPQAPGLPAQLLSDLCHEIAQVVQAPVRQAAVRCLHRQAARRAADVGAAD